MRLRWLAAAADEVRQGRHGWLSRHAKPVPEIIPKGDSQLGTGFGQAEEGIAAVAAIVTSGATADLPLRYVAADVAFRSIGVQWDVWMVEHGQQFGLVGMQPRQQAIEGDEAGATAEDAVDGRGVGRFGAVSGCCGRLSARRRSSRSVSGPAAARCVAAR